MAFYWAQYGPVLRKLQVHSVRVKIQGTTWISSCPDVWDANISLAPAWHIDSSAYRCGLCAVFFSQPLTSVTMWKAKLQITSNHRMGQYVREFQRHAAEGKVPRSFLVPWNQLGGSRSDIKVCSGISWPVFSGSLLQSVSVATTRNIYNSIFIIN